MAHAYSQTLEAELAIVAKRRKSATEVESMAVIGEIEGKNVLLVDDGLATGAYEKLGRIADRVWALLVDPDFAAVGQYYRQFSQTDDAEVLALLPGRNDGGGQET